MADEYGVFVGTPLDSDVQLARWFRQFAPSGVVHGIPGVEDDWGDRCLTTVDGTGQPVTGTGYLLIGGYRYRINAPIRTPITPNMASQPRWDRLVARADPTEQECFLTILVGTPGVGSPPSPVRESEGRWDVSLAVWQVAPGASVVSPAALSPAREWSSPAGAVPDVDGVGHTALPAGGLVLASDGRLLVRDFDGVDRLVAHTGYPTPWQPITLRSGYQQSGSGYAPSWRYDAPGIVRLRGTITRSNGQPLPTGEHVATLPAAIRPAAFTRYVCPAHATGSGWSVRGEIRSSSASGAGQLTIWHQYSPLWMALDGWTYPI